MSDFPKELKKNLIFYYIFETFSFPLFWLPVLPIYLAVNKGLDPYLVTGVLSLQEFLLIFLEVPTGVVADRVSRKLSVALGTFIMSLPFLFLPFVNSFWLIILVFAVKAFGKAFISGANASLLYDLLKDYNLENRYKYERNRSHSFAMAFAAISILIGGFVAEINPDVTMLLSFPFLLVSTISMMFVKEPEVSIKAKQIQSINYFVHVKDSIKVLWSIKGGIFLLLIYVVVDSLLVNLKYLYAPILSNLGVSFSVIGSVTFFVYVFKSLSLTLSNRIIKGEGSRLFLKFSILVIIGLLLLLIFKNLYLTGIGLMIAMFFAESLSTVIDQEWHDNLNSAIRATASSTLNLFSSLGATLLLNIFGVLQVSSINYSIIFLISLFLIAGIASLKYQKIRKTSN